MLFIKTFLVALIALSSIASAKHYEIYILAGQSNANGRGHTADFGNGTSRPEFEFYKTAQTDVLFYYHKTQAASNNTLPVDQWIDLAPGSGHGTFGSINSPEIGPEVSFGDALADAYPSENIAILKYAHGGTNLHTQWNAGGLQYSNLLATVQAARMALENAGHTYTLRGFLWQQGEADMAAANSYQANLTSLVNRVRADIFYGLSRPFIIGKLSDNQTSISGHAGFPVVRAAQDNVAVAMTNVATVDTDDDTKFPIRADNIHFNGIGQIEIGLGYAAVMQVLLANDPDNDGIVTSEEIALGTDPNKADTDNDGLDDGDEVILGTDPSNGSSRFQISSLVENLDGNLTLTWPSKAGNQYVIERSSTLQEGSWVSVGSITATGASTIWNASTSGTSLAFYGFEGPVGGDFDTISFDSTDTDTVTTAMRLVQAGGLSGGGANSRIINDPIFSPSQSGNNGLNLGAINNQKNNADSFSFTIQANGSNVIYEELSFYHNQFGTNGKIDISYRIGRGIELPLLTGFTPTTGNVAVTQKTINFSDFNTTSDVIFTFCLYGTTNPAYGIRFDDVNLKGSASTTLEDRIFYRINFR